MANSHRPLRHGNVCPLVAAIATTTLAAFSATAAPSKAKVVTDADRDWWAFRPLQAIAPPAGGSMDAVPHPIHRFLLARLEEKNLAINPPADHRTRLRRASFDLTGLPPTPEEMDAFVRDDALDAWTNAVKRLLTSPRHGERWARHWLDVALFAESSGFEHDYDRPNAYHYRDFVDRHGHARTDHRLRPLPRSQVRSDPRGRLLPDALDLHDDGPQRHRA